jgi:C4-type Zn-finger protein
MLHFMHFTIKIFCPIMVSYQLNCMSFVHDVPYTKYVGAWGGVVVKVLRY